MHIVCLYSVIASLLVCFKKRKQCRGPENLGMHSLPSFLVYQRNCNWYFALQRTFHGKAFIWVLAHLSRHPSRCVDTCQQSYCHIYQECPWLPRLACSACEHVQHFALLRNPRRMPPSPYGSSMSWSDARCQSQSTIAQLRDAIFLQDYHPARYW